MNGQRTSVEVTRTYLEIPSRERFVPALTPGEPLRIESVKECPASFFRFLYREVGRQYHWIDRLGWSDAEIREYLNSPGLSFWVAYCEGAPAGYFELQGSADGSVEIAYFGLLPEFIGRGFGKHLLSVAVEQAWSQGARRVWLHTCTLDDPAALPNYLKRGFSPFRQETYVTTISPGEDLRVTV
jgi:GNAT superfamily N-acetyltransferase